jgi:hypothetical protein
MKMYASRSSITVTTSQGLGWVGKEACMGKMRNSYKILVGKPMCRWEYYN